MTFRSRKPIPIPAEPKRRLRKPGGGMAKGASFERAVCKALSLWVSGGKHEDWFWRSAMSGGRSTVGRKVGKHLVQHAGDISATALGAHELTGLFYIECKNVKNLDLGSWIFRGTGKGFQFWLEACREAKHYGKLPMLIAKENVTRTLMVLPSDVPGTTIKFGEVARLPGLAFYDFEQILEQPFWFAHSFERHLEPTEPSR